MGNRIILLLSGWAVQRRRLVLVLSALFALFFASGLPRLQTDSSPDALVSNIAGQAEAREEFRKSFPASEQQVLILVEGKDVTSRAALDFQARLRGELEKQSGVLRVDGLIESELESENEAEALRRALDEAPGITPLLLSRDRSLAALIVHLDDEKVFDQQTRMAALGQSRAIVGAAKIPEGLSVRFGGVPVLGEAILKKLQADRLTLNPAMMILCLLILGATFRWWPAMVAPLLAVGIAALAVVGGMAHLGQPLGILTNIIPALLIIVGLSDSVHLLGRYFEELGRDADRVRAGRRAARAMLVACFLTSLTTAVGFASLATAHTVELRSFGLAAAAGVLVAYFATVLFVPAFVTLMKSPRALQRVGTEGRRSSVGGLERFVFSSTLRVLRHPKVVIAVSALLAVGLGWAASRIGTDARLLDAFDSDEPVAEVTHLLENKMAGIRPLEVLLTSEKASFDDEEVRAQVQEVQRDLEEQEGIITVLSFVDFEIPANLLVASNEEASRVGPAAAKEMLARRDAALTKARETREMWLTKDGRRARLTFYFQDVGIRRTLAVIDELERRLRSLPVPGLRIQFLGEAYTGSVGRDFVLQDLVSGLSLAVGTILALLVLLFRSLRLGLVALPPNVLPLLATAAYMMARGIQLNLATVITFTIGIGLAVDDTVHVVARFLEERKRISSVRVALLRAARGTGRAIVVTAISLVCGFGILLASEFAPVRQFGELIAVTVIGCLIAALVIQPALLLLVLRKKVTRVRA